MRCNTEVLAAIGTLAGVTVAVHVRAVRAETAQRPFAEGAARARDDTLVGTRIELGVQGTNIVGLRGGKCVSYEWNERIMAILVERSFDVIGIPGSQLSIGGGGPHCMTAPIHREV